jgi:hypothetical protein
MAPAQRLAVGDRQACADRYRGELIDRIAAGEPIRKLLFIEVPMRLPFAECRPYHRAGIDLPASTRIVQRKQRPTSKVDSMMVLRARRGRTGSKYVTFRGGLRRAIP